MTIANTGNSTDFGDLTAASDRIGGTSNNVSGFFAGGSVPGLSNVIQKVTIASAGNAADLRRFIFRKIRRRC